MRSESAYIRQVADALWKGHTVEDWTECVRTHTHRQADRQK